jgi:hypothetical protein
LLAAVVALAGLASGGQVRADVFVRAWTNGGPGVGKGAWAPPGPADRVTAYRPHGDRPASGRRQTEGARPLEASALQLLAGVLVISPYGGTYATVSDTPSTPVVKPPQPQEQTTSPGSPGVGIILTPAGGPNTTPEPASLFLGLLGSGLAGLAVARRRRQRPRL